MYHFCPAGTATAAGVGFVAETFAWKEIKTIRLARSVMKSPWKLSRML